MDIRITDREIVYAKGMVLLSIEKLQPYRLGHEDYPMKNFFIRNKSFQLNHCEICQFFYCIKIGYYRMYC